MGASLKNINIPSSVTYIGDYAFAECTLLEDATISSNTTYLGNSAFYMCESLNNIELPLGLEYIKDYTFAYCSNLTKIVIPSSIREIGFGAFMDCETLTDVNFKGTEEQWFSIRIRDYNTPLTLATITFVNQTIEPDFILPSSLQEIGEESFSGGTFVYVKLSENTKSIGRLAFADCPNLRYIYIPEATTSIDRYAFAFVNGLTILGKQNSYAETYANNYGYTFEPFE